MGVSIEEIKEYNREVRGRKDELARCTMESEYMQRELENLCKELTAEIGVQVTVDNINEVYTEHIGKISEAMRNGTEILRRIAESEKANM